MGETLNSYVPDDADSWPVYRPSLRLESDSLWVSFDHRLSCTPEEIEALTVPGPVTTFVIRADAELYAGLAFIPRRILVAVTQGLKAYAESDKYTDEERKQIGYGAAKLERYLTTGER